MKKYRLKYTLRSADNLFEFVRFLVGFKGLTRPFLRSLTDEKRARVNDYYTDQWWIANDNILTRPAERPSFLPASAEGPTPKWQRRREAENVRTKR